MAQNISVMRSEFPASTGLSAIVQPSGFANRTAFATHITALADGGIDGFAFYNYGQLRQTHVEWIGACRAAWS